MVNQKVGLQFFYIDTNIELDDKIALIEAKHGHLGFYVVIKLYVKIYGDKGYYCEWTEETALIFSRRINVVPDQLDLIVEDALKFKLFNANLFKKYKILTSKRIQDHYLEATKRRKVVELKKPYILINGNNDNILRENVHTLGDNVDSLKQMKVDEREMKVKYMSAVLLTATEYKKLVEKFGEKDTLNKIENLDYYIGSKGKKYKSHYMTILSWDLKENNKSEDWRTT